MNKPFQLTPELRATFQTDASTLIQAAGAQLTNLAGNSPDLSFLPVLRNAIHTLRGAAAMVGAQTLTRLIDDYQRLIEVADSFKLTARDKAQQAFAFLEKNLDQIHLVVEATLAGNEETAQNLYQALHKRVIESWGGYFYANAPEESETPPPTSPAETRKSVKECKTSHAKSDNDAIALEFLSSLGVPTPPTPAIPSPMPAPAPAPSPAKLTVKSNRAAASSSPAEPELPVDAEQIDPEMLSYFVLETSESLAQLEALLLAWEKNNADSKIAHSIFRLVHTIKGAANSLGLARIGRLLHGLEDLLETHVVDRSYAKLTELIEICFGVADTVKVFIRDTQTGKQSAANNNRSQTLSRRIAQLAAEAPAEESLPAPVPARPPAREITPAPAPAVSALPLAAPAPEPEILAPLAADADRKDDQLDHQTIRVESDRLDLLMNLIGELVISRSRLEKKLSDISRLKDEMSFGKTRLFQAITDFQGKYEYSRPTMERNRLVSHSTPSNPAIPGNRRAPSLDNNASLLGGFSDLEFDQYDDFNILARSLMEIGTDTGEIFSQLNRFFDVFGEETNQFSKITARLQDEITRVRMMPLTLLFKRLQRSARDASRKEHKTIDFQTTGNETRLDKLILDKLYTPLLHIVRNAVSHGIESEAERQQAGKPASGTIELLASCETNQVVIEVRDDGRGLDLAQIRAIAIQRGLLAPGTQVDDETLIQFIFTPGFSTAAKVTDVSGRGVGLDVVRLEIARLSGTIHVRSTPGQGCSFIIHLPLTLAINQAMFIEVGTEVCALPLNFVERVQDCTADDVTTSGTQELIHTPEGLVPLLRLHRMFGVAEQSQNPTVVLARVADRRVAIGVDRILRKQDIVVKSLGTLLRGHPLFSGATLGGDGQVVLIVDLPRLLETEKSAAPLPVPSRPIAVTPEDSASQQKPLILVVDDSLSVRKVIEKHLLSLDYRVELAVDGLDALEKLRLHPVALVLTDLEMPRMHGFELVAEMRRHDSTRGIPIIVVTSRDADKHRRRAESLGANDYIIKPFSREQLADRIEQQLAAPKL